MPPAGGRRTVGAALLVARRDRSHMAAVQDLVATLSEGPAELAGVIFNEY